jgi:2-dehydro-3-deoxy-D-gluconate 5-dehydrogenase
MSVFDLSGRVAIVTGGNGGIGLGMAEGLAKAGAAVIVAARNREKSEEAVAKLAASGAASAFIPLDVADPESCREMVRRTVERFGRLDILVNNAGTIRRSPAAEYSEEDWASVIEVNLSSVFRLSQLAGRHMLERGSGKIVNVASLLSFQGGVTVPAYAASKGGVAQLTKALANEWASKGINVNAIAPGYMRTDNTAALQKDETRSRQILERIPAGRWGEAADLAGAAVFLSSPASDYVNGHVLVVDGGWMGR